ncbi:hypothetical protein PHAVU_006G117500 [Phaseolus vulgaris]|uniref:Pectinesterase inhibitor domain-containing protein n=1 Tax=Phaseolus vulgaris TaxID=3885 RepID=V7BQQ8_PHAVU|nr:hypothetical protein PHAVU_006G117500g [Phaseolus vulgaris]ESW19353.1 hypothetical protein PHAVU_006G117500g [Phaseolus vulgaris]
MKLNINCITLFTASLVLCFAVCTSHVPPSAEESPESPPHHSPKSPPHHSPKSPPHHSPKSPPHHSPKSPPHHSPKSPPHHSPKSPPSADPPSAADPPFSFPPTEFSNTEEPVPTEDGQFGVDGSGGRSGGGGGGGQLNLGFTSFFAEIHKGSLRGSKTITKLNKFDKDDSESVKKICSHTDYPDDCLSTVVPFLKKKFDVKNVLEAAIKACSLQVNFTSYVVTKHMKSSPDMANALTGCKDQYSNAIQSLHHATKALSSHNIGTVTIMLSSVVADVSACESSFQDLKVALPKGNSEGMAGITASNCLSIASMIPS